MNGTTIRLIDVAVMMFVRRPGTLARQHYTPFSSEVGTGYTNQAFHRSLAASRRFSIFRLDLLPADFWGFLRNAVLEWWTVCQTEFAYNSVWSHSMSVIERTAAGLQTVIPGCEGEEAVTYARMAGDGVISDPMMPPFVVIPPRKKSTSKKAPKTTVKKTAKKTAENSGKKFAKKASAKKGATKTTKKAATKSAAKKFKKTAKKSNVRSTKKAKRKSKK
jgi:hypothetical protein